MDEVYIEDAQGGQEAQNAQKAQGAQTTKHAVQKSVLKREASLAPRLAAKLKELESRGLFSGAKAHVCPLDAARIKHLVVFGPGSPAPMEACVGVVRPTPN